MYEESEVHSAEITGKGDGLLEAREILDKMIAEVNDA
jgi:hypothetical protein